MKQFKYDVVKLIENIRDRPCLWDKAAENYKDRVERKTAWIEIFNILDERYEEMSSDDKRLTSEIVISKWTNIRDTFVKTLRKSKGRKKRHYVLYDHLKFLIPATAEANQDNLGYFETTEEPGKDYDKDYERDSDASYEPEVTYKPTTSKRKKVKIESPQEDSASPIDTSNLSSNIDFVSVDDPRIMNEDEAFFASLLPTVVKYSEDERLEFRIEVLSLMKRINDKRKWSGNQ